MPSPVTKRIASAAELIKSLESSLEGAGNNRIRTLATGLATGMLTAEKSGGFSDNDIDDSLAYAICTLAMRRLGRTGVEFENPDDFAAAFKLVDALLAKTLAKARSHFDQPLT